MSADCMECSTGMELDDRGVDDTSDTRHIKHSAAQLQRRSHLSRSILRRDDAVDTARHNPWRATSGNFSVALVRRVADGACSPMACNKSTLGKSLADTH